MSDDHRRYYPHSRSTYGEEMDDLRTRLSTVESRLGEVDSNVRLAKNDIQHLREDISAAVEGVTNLTDTISRWKGAIVLIVVASPMLGPLLAMLVRYLIFGAPLSAH